MAELGAGSLPLGEPAFSYQQEQELNERLKRLYPAVNEEETPLPRSWSPKDKYSYIGLSQNNLRVHYKGIPKRVTANSLTLTVGLITNQLNLTLSTASFVVYLPSSVLEAGRPSHCKESLLQKHNKRCQMLAQCSLLVQWCSSPVANTACLFFLGVFTLKTEQLQDGYQPNLLSGSNNAAQTVGAA
ncbi:hypothetical protein GOODEAATRI_014634 [Goodea atripinnis]|uniref:Ran-binding protein 10 n=1 Tax=Goodea atripinnis TaxID=208336 RepID=A0ABV0NUI2_9TELE